MSTDNLSNLDIIWQMADINHTQAVNSTDPDSHCLLPNTPNKKQNIFLSHCKSYIANNFHSIFRLQT